MTHHGSDGDQKSGLSLERERSLCSVLQHRNKAWPCVVMGGWCGGCGRRGPRPRGELSFGSLFVVVTPTCRCRSLSSFRLVVMTTWCGVVLSSFCCVEGQHCFVQRLCTEQHITHHASCRCVDSQLACCLGVEIFHCLSLFVSKEKRDCFSSGLTYARHVEKCVSGVSTPRSGLNMSK